MNPRVLVWARERTGLSIKEVARLLGKDEGDVQAWESGEMTPTYIQLEALAYRVYKRPIALFFFPEPPTETDPRQAFRTLPNSELEKLWADTRYRIRDARAKQIALAELTTGKNPADRQILHEFTITDDVTETASRLRGYLQIPLEIQTERWETNDEALNAWRAAVEHVGVFVFKHSFKQRDVFGFSLFDRTFPIIMINNSNATTRQVFTLFHELVHLLLNVGGVTKADDKFIRTLSGESRHIEVLCNKLAAEFLAPRDVVRVDVQQLGTSDSAVRRIAEKYKVSREVILRTYLDLRLITRDYYEDKLSEWTREYEDFVEAAAEKKTGGNYYYTHAAYLSDQYARLAFSNFYRGAISVDQLADYLNASVKSIPGLEQAILQRARE